MKSGLKRTDFRVFASSESNGVWCLVFTRMNDGSWSSSQFLMCGLNLLILSLHHHQYAIYMAALPPLLRESASVLCVLSATRAIGFEPELRVGCNSDKLNLTWSEGTVDHIWPVRCCYSSTNKGKVELHMAAGERIEHLFESIREIKRIPRQKPIVLVSPGRRISTTPLSQTPSGADANNEETSSCTERTGFRSPLRQIDSL